jgi:hypothetical protein
MKVYVGEVISQILRGGRRGQTKGYSDNDTMSFTSLANEKRRRKLK